MISEEQQSWLSDFFDKCEKKISSIMDDVKNDYPLSIGHNEMKYDETVSYEYGWTSGFWGGLMWLLYNCTGSERYLNRAIRCSERFADAMGTENGFACLDNHDLGFVFGLTNVPHYKILSDNAAKIRALHAAAMLAGRFNPSGNYIVAWSTNMAMGRDTRGYAIIDCLLNLPLLYWASEETNDPRYAQIAKKHAYMAEKEFFKPDGSVYHIVDFDCYTGKVKGYPRGQGYESGSSWSRGQSWALYGFMMSYIHTKEPCFFEDAKRVADYIIKNFGSNELAPVDFMQPAMPQKYDASASAVIACGMIEISKYCDKKEAPKYTDFAIRLLKGLYKDCDFGYEKQSILQSATELYHTDVYHISLIYADYFLVEALSKILDKTNFFMW